MGIKEQDPTLTIETEGDEEEASILGKLENWFEESKTAMSAQRERWRKNEKNYYNDVTIPGAKSNTKLKFNLALTSIETEMPIIADYLPTFDVLPERKEDMFFSDKMNKRKNQVERKIGFKDKTLEGVFDSLLNGCGLTQIMPVDFDKNGSLDGVEMSTVDPFTWFPSPGATGMDIKKDAMYHIFATPMNVEEIKRQYKITVEPEGYLDEYRAFQEVEVKDGETKTLANSALVKECYFMDEDEEKYPNGRFVLWITKQIITDEPLELERIPYFLLGNYKTSHTLFGIGEPELIRSQIKTLNQVMSSIADNINKSGNPVLTVLRNLVQQIGTRIGIIPGEQVVVDTQDDLRWLVPPNIPAYTFTFIDTLLKLTDTVSGKHDVTEGRRPEGITAGIAIAELQEAAQMRIRYKITKEINKYVVEMGKFIIWILQKYDKEMISIREQDENGKSVFSNYDPDVKYDVKSVEDEGIPEDAEGYDKNNAMTLAESHLDVEIVAGVRMPVGRVATEERALKLFEVGIYGIKDVVMALATGNKEEIINNYNQRQGIEGLIKRYEELNKAEKEFEGLIDKLLSELEVHEGEEPESKIDAIKGSLLEERVSEFLKQYPEFLISDEFKVLPDELQARLLLVFTEDEETIEEEV